MNKKQIKIKIDPERCKGCMFCISACPKKTVLAGSKEINKRGVQFIVVKNPEDCTACALCAVMCPDCAIEIWAG